MGTLSWDVRTLRAAQLNDTKPKPLAHKTMQHDL